MRLCLWTAAVLLAGGEISVFGGEAVDATRAQEVAARWLSQTAAPEPIAALALAPAEAQPAPQAITDRAGATLAHVVRLGERGFVVVAGDTDVDPILFFSTDTSPGDLADPRHPLRALFQTDVPARQAAARANQISLKDVHARWERLSRPLQSAEPLSSIPEDQIIIWNEPCIDTHWAQHGAYTNHTPTLYTYNRLTPEHYPAGCVAVAMGQVARWFQYPDQASDAEFVQVDGNDLHSSYNLRFDYDLMPNDVSDRTPENMISQVANFLSACGISVETAYTETSSSADSTDVATALKDVFGYASATGFYTFWGERRDAIRSDLTLGYPVIIGIHTAAIFGKGHAIVADGYGLLGSQEIYHFNFGWGGNSDGWYSLPNLVDEEGLVWNTFSQGVVGIRPPMRRGVDLYAGPAGADAQTGQNVRESPGSVSVQRCSAPASLTAAACFRVTVQNEGTHPDYFQLTSSGASSGWSVTFLNESDEDVTAALLADGLETPLTRPSLLRAALRVALIPQAGTPVGAVGSVEVVCRSTSDASKVDAFVFQATHVPCRPNVLICAEGTWPPADRALPADLPAGGTARYDVFVVNGSANPERYLIDAWSQDSNAAEVDPLADTPQGWSVTWSDAYGRDITALLRGGWWRTDQLAAGATQRLSLAVSPSAGARGGQSIRFYFRARNSTGSFEDLATGQARKLDYAPALHAGRSPDAMEDPVQIQQAVNAAPAAFYVRLANAGEAPDAMRLRAYVSGSSEWTVSVEHLSPSLITEDISAAVFSSAGWQVSPTLPAGHDRIFRITVTPAEGVPAGAACAVSLAAASEGDPQRTDLIKLETRCGMPGVEVEARTDEAGDYYHEIIASSRQLTLGDTEQFWIRVRNTGGLPESFVVRAAETGELAWTAYYYDGTNGFGSGIREMLVGPGGWSIGPLAAGESYDFLATVQAGGANIPNGSDFLSVLTATAQGNASLTDSVTLLASRVSYGVDMRIRSQADPTFCSGSTTGRCGATPAVFNVQVRNWGAAEDSFLLRGSTWAPAGAANWSVRFFNANTGDEITSTITNAGWGTATLPSLVSQDIRIEVLADAGLFAGDLAYVTLLADSSSCTSATGGVTAVAEKAAYRPRVRVAPDGSGGLMLGSLSTLTTRVDTVRHRFEITNDGEDDFFDLQGTVLSGAWQCRFLGPEGDDWTESLTAGMRIVMPARTNLTLTAEVTPTPEVSGGSICSMGLRATSYYDPVWWESGAAYTVRAVAGVDVQVKRGGAYGEVSADADALPGFPAIYYWRVVNTGETDDRFALQSWFNSDYSSDWTIRHFESEQGGAEITSAVAAPEGLTIGPLAPGQAYYLRSEAWPSSNLAAGATCQIHLRARPTTGAPVDTLSASNVVRRAASMDVAVRKAESLTYTNLVVRRVSAGSGAAFYMRIANTGPAADAFGVRIVKQSANEADWSVRWFDGASDVSEAVRAGSYVMGPVSSGEDRYLRLEVAPVSTNYSAGPMLLTVEADSRGDPVANGSVRANTYLRMPLVITHVTLADGGDALAVGWQSEAGISYALQGSDTPAAGTFTNLISGIVATDVTCTVTSAPPAAARAFLRVVEEQE